MVRALEVFGRGGRLWSPAGRQGRRPLRWLAGLAGLIVLALPAGALAQSTPEATAISIGAPATAQLGETVTLQAVLVDSSGRPVPKEAVSFTRPSTTFLSATDEVVVAQAVTDNRGVAVAKYEVHSAGDLTLSAEFKGDNDYAASQTDAQMKVPDTSRQLYVQEAGVRVPGLNQAPLPGTMMVSEQQNSLLALIASLWPRLSFWPIAAALLIVWSMYARVAKLIFQIAVDKGDDAAVQAARVFKGFAAVRAAAEGEEVRGDRQPERAGGDR